MHTIKTLFSILLATVAVLMFAAFHGDSGVIEEDDKTFLVDRTGERWNITDAVSIGFKPGGFEFGIGRNAIVPLDESKLEANSRYADAGARVIGVENGSDAHAYVVWKLARHEIANTRLGETPIAAAY